ncbi:NEQ260 [Nanoarchaeum equitans Kin4-M]|uniref:NEQ260 n=1 Tax=Nanoarchaeum equitans (strain Kin4-M) TaxID=228908 RepID=Q74MS8_NANEQ|nr:NEQ260 [Nanoarchaeum equitans Kin4-M]
MQYLYLLAGITDILSLVLPINNSLALAVWLYIAMKDKNFWLYIGTIMLLLLPQYYLVPYNIGDFVILSLYVIAFFFFGLGLLEYNNLLARITGIIYILAAAYFYLGLPLDKIATILEGIYLLERSFRNS